MEFSAEDESRILARAESIDVHFHRRVTDDRHDQNNSLTSTRLDRWCEVVAHGDRAFFAERLALDGLDLKDAQRLLSSQPSLNPDEQTPWFDTLKELLRRFDASTMIDIGAGGTSETPFPFEHAYSPFLSFARVRIREQIGQANILVSSDAHSQLERILLQRLSFLCGRSLQVQFSVYRAQRRSSLGRLLASNEMTRSDQLYRAFINTLFSGGWTSFFGEYPVLARLAVAVCDHWVSFVGEFILRLQQDVTQVQDFFGCNDPVGKVALIRPAFSDSHNCGRSVIAFEFESGMALVYKPKPSALEARWADFLSWVNARNSPLHLKAAKVLNRQGYGWAEFINQRPCRNREEVKRYYMRSGMLVCLVYALQGTDYHLENLVACGEHPVLIDLETLLQPRIREKDLQRESEAHLHVQRCLEHSVLRTGLLPAWDIAPGGSAYDVSGLGGVHEWSFRRLAWENLNTDSMTLIQESVATKPQSNAPALEGLPVDPCEFVDEIVYGFCAMYRWLTEHRNVVLSSMSPLSNVVHEQVRYVFRPTKVYGALLDKLSHPRYFRSGLERSIELDVLTQGIVEPGKAAPWWLVLKAEHEALERLDVPLFMVPVDCQDLPLPSGGVVTGFFERSAWQQLSSGLKRLNENDMNEQISFIRAAFHLRDSRQIEHVYVTEDVPEDAIDSVTSQELVEHALQIAAEIRARAIRAADGSVDWICPTFVTQAGRFQLQPIGYNLYDGTSGLALFFAAIERLRTTGEFGDLALQTLRPLRETLKRTGSRRSLAAHLGIGGTSGLGSIVYGLATVGLLLDQSSLLEDAESAASLITLQAIREVPSVDVTDGVAGTALGLLVLHGITGKSETLELALECGKRLVDDRTTASTGHATWKTLEGVLLTGFSHGAAGIAYALLRLYGVTGRDDFLKAAEEGIAYECSQFSTEAGNWPDFRRTPGDNGTQIRFMTSWCHGAPGIGLARLGSLDVLSTAQIRQDADVALTTTLEYGVQGADHLCCGNMGRLDLLIEASQRLKRPDLIEEARRQASQVLTRAAREGSFLLNFKPLPGMYLPGFFNGLSGIGYGLLRVAYPNSLPSILSWH